MGGVMVRYFLEHNELENIHRVVMLAPPPGVWSRSNRRRISWKGISRKNKVRKYEGFFACAKRTHLYNACGWSVTCNWAIYG